MDLKKTSLREEISPYPSFLFLKVDYCEKEEKRALSSNELGVPLGILNIFGDACEKVAKPFLAKYFFFEYLSAWKNPNRSIFQFWNYC